METTTATSTPTSNTTKLLSVLTASVILVFTSQAQPSRNPFAKSDREIGFYTKTVDLFDDLMELHANLPRLTCVSSFFPAFLDEYKPEKILQYDAMRKKMTGRLKEFYPGQPAEVILQRLPNACEDLVLANKKFKKLKRKVLEKLETLLAISILVLEQHDIFSKAKKYRKLYRRLYPNRNLEKEFSKRYIKQK